jgi:lysophospholipid acyltransferase (LPLAT)-like uncharacterized protein
VALLLRLLVATWRVRVVGEVELLEGDEPAIFAFWHTNLVPCGIALRRRRLLEGRPVAALMSRSADGELLARAGSSFGFAAVRGSTSRGALAGIRGLYRALVRERSSVVITPDGPRGPAGEVKPGVAELARLTGAPIVPMAASAGSAWVASSWDRMLVPKPFAGITVICGAPLRIDRAASLDEAGARLRDVLERLGEA